MNKQDRQLSHKYWIRGSFDDIVASIRSSRLSFEEADLLRESHWELGKDARLREDVRFRCTPWGRWILSDCILANDAIYNQLHRDNRFTIHLESYLIDLEKSFGRHCMICKADPRIIVEGDLVHLSSRELSNTPRIEKDPVEIEKFITHLPVYTLKAAAASEPAGEWGPEANEQAIETLGWLKVSLAGQKLNPQMFVARIEGNSMDNGRNGLVDGAYAVFELWPKLSKQNLVVLVRGAFTDSETGSYAVKKYVADQRDVEGRHHRVTLVSLNPDKERYPDIELAVEDDDDVTVVARFVQALSPGDFARQPKKPKKPGRRNLTSENAITNIGKALSRHAYRFFGGCVTKVEIPEKTALASWKADIICLDAESGGVHLEIGPLQGLWSFVKQLRISGKQWEAYLLASNARTRPERLSVPPGSGPWRIQAVNFEDDPDVDLSTLDRPEISTETVNAFRVDAEGVGRAIKTRKLSPGQEYRLLLPPSYPDLPADLPGMSFLGDGWRIWEFVLPLVPSEALIQQIQLLEFDLGCSQPRMEWVLEPPVEWRTTPRSVVYPCFLANSSPVVAIEGLKLYLKDEALFFIHGPTGTHPVNLPVGEELMVQLSSLAIGRYVVALLHRDTKILPARLAFEVVSEHSRPPIANWCFTWGEEQFIPGEKFNAVVGPRDLTLLDSKKNHSTICTMEMPPGWHGRLVWREIAEDYLGNVFAGLNGVLDLDEILKLSRERRQRRPVGDLVLDLRELGRLTLKHVQTLDPQTIQAKLTDLIKSRGQRVLTLAGAYPELLRIWFQPVCRLLGYDVEPFVSNEIIAAPAHMIAYRLVHTHRLGGTIKKHSARLLVVMEDLHADFSGEIANWVDSVCIAGGLWDVILSDGLLWAVRRRGSRLALNLFDMEALLNDKEQFIGFLRVAAEGV